LAPELGSGPHERAKNEKRWGLGDAALGFAVGICAQGLLGSVAYAAGGNKLTLGAVAAGLFGLWLGLAGVAVWASMNKGSASLVRDFGLRVAGWGDAVGGIAAGLASQLILVPVLYAPLFRASPSIKDKLEKPARDLVDLVHGNGGVVVLTLLVVVGAPVVEELFFRGLLQRSLHRRLGPVWAVALSALAFGLAHQELLQLPALVAFGIVLGVLAQRSGRLGPGIFAHIAFNAVTVFSLVHAR
jgi:membrane protease YdiL (CAAX protease family)